MKYIKIGDLCNVSSSKRVFARQYVDNGIPFYRQKEVIDKKNGNTIEEPIYISESDYNIFKAKFGVPANGDLLITAVGATLGIPYFVGNEQFYFKDGNLIWLSNFKEKLNSKFLYYWIDSSFGTQTLWNRTIGSAQPALTIDSIKKLSIPVPSKAIQDKISTTLTTFDQIIENNNKRIKLLEKMTENLYKEWFVRFRFPGYEDTEFEDGMPRDWVREKIGLHYNTCSGGTPSRKHEEYYTEGTIPWVKTGEIKDGIIIHTDECITEAGIKGSSAKLLPQGAVVMAMYGVNIGMLAYLDSEMTCNQACCVFNDKNEINSRHYLFHYLYSIRDYLLLIGFGAAQQNLSQDLIKKVKIVIPPAELIKEFDKQKEPLYQTIRALMMQNDKLIKQRDALLPRLMSGKLEV